MIRSHNLYLLSKYFNLFLSLVALLSILFYWYKFINFKFNGPIGDIGYMGERGNTGQSGKIGIDGPNIDRTIDNMELNIDGPKGPPGLIGDEGPIGLIGKSGEKGPIGLKGPIGSIGKIGPIGLKGQKGSPGIQGEHIDNIKRLYTKYKNEDCIWSIDKECPDNNIISGVRFEPYLSYKCCPTRLYVL